MSKSPNTERKLLKDGWRSSLGGVDSGRSPSLIDPTQIAYAVNVTGRGGFYGPRPAFLSHTLTFQDAEREAWFKTHKLQGSAVYHKHGAESYGVAVVGGRVWLVDTDTDAVTEITPLASTKLTQNFAAPEIGVDAINIYLDDITGISEGVPIYISGAVYTVKTVTSDKLVTATNLNDVATTAHSTGDAVYRLDMNNPLSDRAYLCQAEKWLIIQDGKSKAILYDGSKSRRSEPFGTDKPEVPTGTWMVYANGRLHVAITERQFCVGDLYASDSSKTTQPENDVILFTENDVVAEGGALRVWDDITGMFTTNVIDTSLGQGPVLILTKDKVYSFNAPVDRTQWMKLTYPIVTVAANHGGAVSGTSVSQVNSDLFYRSSDGVRSFKMARREDSEWGNVPVSGEMDRVLKEDAEDMLPWASSMVFGNRLYMTVSPIRTATGIAHRGMTVLDFSPISRMGSKSAPCWEGIWNGVLPTQFMSGEFNGKQRGFIWSLNANGTNELWEVRPEYKLDNKERRIQCAVEFRSMDFQTPLDAKKLSQCELWIEGIEGQIDLDLRYRPDQSPCWYQWKTRSLCVTNKDCSAGSGSCFIPINFKPGYRARLGFGQPPDGVCDRLDNKPVRVGYEFQLRLAWAGQMRLRKMLVKADEIEEWPFSDLGDLVSEGVTVKAVLGAEEGKPLFAEEGQLIGV